VSHQRRALIVAAVLLAAPLDGLRAHTLGEGYVFLTVYTDHLEGQLEVLVDDLDGWIEIDHDADGKVSDAEVEARREEIARRLEASLAFSLGETSLTTTFDAPQLMKTHLGRYIQIPFRVGGLAAQIEEIGVTYDVLFDRDPGHRGLLIIQANRRTGYENPAEHVALRFDSSTRHRKLDLTGKRLDNAFVVFLREGIDHIWFGIDHILFLIALLLPTVLRREKGRFTPVDSFATALWNVAGVITIFTLAHSVTLSLAALEIVTLSPRIVEPIIALSIAIAAFDLVVPIFRGRIWLVVFVFGLFHGFGWATALRELGLERTNLLQPLVGFNLGVEVGQLAIVLAVFPVLWLVRRWNGYSRVVVPGAALILIGVALCWFVERTFDIAILPEW